jgi:hypothetical protein
MGSQSHPNHGLLIGVIDHLLDLMEADAREAWETDSISVANKLWKIRAYVCILMAA